MESRLPHLTPPAAPQISIDDTLPLLLDVGAVARELGVSTRQVFKLSAAGRLPKPIHIARSARWRRDELTAWIEAGCPAMDR